MIKQLSLLAVLLLSFTLCAQKESKEIEQFVNDLDQRIPQLLDDFIVPGAAIAIIENSERTERVSRGCEPLSWIG